MRDGGEIEKRCARCNEWKLLTFEYYGHTKVSTDGFSCYCKCCESLKRKSPEFKSSRKNQRDKPHRKEQASQYAKQLRAMPEYKNRDRSGNREYEEQQRNLLTDRIVKRGIYIASKGKITYDQMTPEMIADKRASILAYRQKIEMMPPKPEKIILYCEICGDVIVGRGKHTCSDECRKERERRRSFQNNKSKKLLIERKCKECEKLFIPEYGNKRRDFCSDKCLGKFIRKGNPRKSKERADYFGVLYEYINVFKVFDRDGWRCQICGKKTPKKNRGTNYSNAPELDHRIPMSKGGDHLYKNVQCTCRKCNGSKSNNNEAGQIPLFEIGM
jgi:predicted nucleic acid-binding Zn ribbon protein